jgi:hypothetical protein
MQIPKLSFDMTEQPNWRLLLRNANICGLQNLLGMFDLLAYLGV